MRRVWGIGSVFAVEREAARILTKLASGAHVVATASGVRMEIDISRETFDRFCVWDCACHEFEETDFPEDGHDIEEEDRP